MQKRVFFGLEAFSPWPEKLPAGRLLDVEHRHLTTSFLGEVDFEKLKEILPDFPKPPFKVGLSGFFDSCLTFPRVAAWHVNFLSFEDSLQTYVKKCNEWLGLHGFAPKHADKPLLPHVTLARRPFYPREWKKAFSPRPVTFSTLHLYESLGYSKYGSVWHYPLKNPIIEIPHTADIAYQIRGETVGELQQHALIALAFTFPQILDFYGEMQVQNSLDDMIIALNDLVALVDGKIGCPFKAVSFHGDLKEEEETLLWEMVIDV